ncbi:MAG: MBL fold metallo-hydrolase [Thermoanaerobaculia bacterium]
MHLLLVILTALAQAAAPYVVVLGIVQDGGLPHAGCEREHCERARRDPGHRRLVSSLAIVDPATGERWIVDATPDFPLQLAAVGSDPPAGILLTHAHIGHYTGLMYLGREVMGARGVSVYAMPRMAAFLRENGPWSQLVELGNIELRPLEDGVAVELNERISVVPFRVPHRDEFSETVGFLIRGPDVSVVFIPDIDKWERWDRRIEDVIASADVAYLDGTFFADGEVPGRAMAEIPHPFIAESLARFASLPPEERAKIRFIHLNHTNPALDPESEARRAVERAGMRVAEEGERIPLASNDTLESFTNCDRSPDAGGVPDV